MAIHESARFSNFIRSVNKYVQDQLEGAAGLPTKFPSANIWWQDRPFDPDKVSYYLRPHFLDDEGRYYSQVETGAGGHLKMPRLFVDVFVKREYARQQSNAYLLRDALDTVKGAFMAPTGIAVVNYQGSGVVTLGKAWVRGREPTTPKADRVWLAGGFMVSLQWIEQDVAA